MGITAHSSDGQNSNSRLFQVTGATGTPVKVIARQLAITQDAKVVLICRDLQKVVWAVNEITFLIGNSGVSYALADLSRYQQIHNVTKLYLF